MGRLHEGNIRGPFTRNETEDELGNDGAEQTLGVSQKAPLFA